MVGSIRYDIREIREFLTNLIAHQDMIEIYGLNYFLRKQEESSINNIERHLESFQSDLYSAMLASRFIDKTLFDSIDDTLKETKLLNAIANLRVQVAIARKEKPSSLIAIQFRFIRRYFPFMRFIKLGSKLFDDEDISINIILASLYRIESIFETVEMLQHRRRQSDDEIFKPSNVNLSFIAEHIEVAITEIHQASMSSAERDKLIEYLEEALSELSKDTPAWKKIVGALVIAATLLSGMAVAPTAYENVNKALQHILGTSIEHQMPTFPTLPRHEEGNESTDDEAGPGISI